MSRGGWETKKMGVCRVGLRCVFHSHATGGVFRSPSTHRMPFCQHLTKSHSRISPSTGLSLVVEYITIQWQYILEIRRISLLHYTNTSPLYTTNYIRIVRSEQRVVVSRRPSPHLPMIIYFSALVKYFLLLYYSTLLLYSTTTLLTGEWDFVKI